MKPNIINASLLVFAALLQLTVVAGVVSADPCKTALGTAVNPTAYNNPNCQDSECFYYPSGGTPAPCQTGSPPATVKLKCEVEREVYPLHYSTCDEVEETDEHKCCEERYSKAHKVRCRCETTHADENCTNTKQCKVSSVTAGDTQIGPYKVQLDCASVAGGGYSDSPCVDGRVLSGLDPKLTAVCPSCP